MRFTNANLFINGSFVKGSFEVRDGRFGRIEISDQDKRSGKLTIAASGAFRTGKKLQDGRNDAADRQGNLGIPALIDLQSRPVIQEHIDLQGRLVIPGLIDLHGHGNSGYDFSTCDLEGLKTMAGYLAKNGITSFAPASMTMPYDRLERAFSNAAQLHALQAEGTSGCSCSARPDGLSLASGLINSFGSEGSYGTSRLVGINMEGPFFSHGKKGAQDPHFLKAPDYEGFRQLYDGCGGLIRIVDVAPELDGAMEFIRKASELCTVSVAHTEADYETVLDAFANGAGQMTHLFNGMNGIHHRSPGPIGAAFDTPEIYVELICDGIHVAPSVIRMVFELFRGRVILISDALACCGMPDGRFLLGEQEVTLKDHRATLADGTLAGSASNLFDMLRNAVSFGIPLEEAILSATANPARQLGAANELGSIEEGKKADFLICSESLQLEAVYMEGDRITG